MKKIVVLLGLSLVLFSCKDNSYPAQSYQPQMAPAQVVVEPASNFGDGLDLQALGELVKNSRSAEDIENRLNQPNSINNLDLDQDGQVDYIKVSEYGSGNSRGFTFTVDTPDGGKQDIANVDVNNAGQQVNLNIQGNQQIYGAPVNYQSSFSASDVLLMHYLLSYHRPYYSPYHYGYYPSYYRPYRSVPHTTYRTKTITKTTYKKNVSYNKNRSYNNSDSYTKKYKTNSYDNSVNKRSSVLSSPTKSQKSFNVTSREKSRPNTNGFKNSYTSPSTTKKSSGGFFGSSSKTKSYDSPSSTRKSTGGFFGSSNKSKSYSSPSKSSSSSRSFGSSSRSSRKR